MHICFSVAAICIITVNTYQCKRVFVNLFLHNFVFVFLVLVVFKVATAWEA